ncbi:hypothetical protein [Streptomyces albicerus]|uniref:hypothetical protein n=1 Tax=Streptomyces albicerus TaxID=2569859 RepID=UPI001788DF19|nr:hypothetical protein [Streptomyces albicerus]
MREPVMRLAGDLRVGERDKAAATAPLGVTALPATVCAGHRLAAVMLGGPSCVEGML